MSDCPRCGWGPFDRVEQTCPNPECENHWTREIESPEAREAQRDAAATNLRRREIEREDHFRAMHFDRYDERMML